MGSFIFSPRDQLRPGEVRIETDLRLEFQKMTSQPSWLQYKYFDTNTVIVLGKIILEEGRYFRQTGGGGIQIMTINN